MLAEEFSFSILPVGERLVVRRIQQNAIGGVIQTEGSKDIGTEAEVMEPAQTVIRFTAPFGPPGALDVEIFQPIRRGDHIFISRFVGVPIDVDGDEDHRLVIIEAKDVLGIKVNKETANASAE